MAEEINLNGIKARLGSVSPTRMWQCGGAINRLLSEDMPRLIALAEVAQQAPKDMEHLIDLSEAAIALVQALTTGDIEKINFRIEQLDRCVQLMALNRAEREANGADFLS